MSQDASRFEPMSRPGLVPRACWTDIARETLAVHEPRRRLRTSNWRFCQGGASSPIYYIHMNYTFDEPPRLQIEEPGSALDNRAGTGEDHLPGKNRC
jgi:hypothetical protein